MPDFEDLSKIEAAFSGLEQTIKRARYTIADSKSAAVLDVFVSRLAQARAESGFPRALDDARIAAGYEQCVECGETLTPEHATGVLDLCARCAGARYWRDQPARRAR